MLASPLVRSGFASWFCVCLLLAGPLQAQEPRSTLILRPSDELLPLAERVARVLTLRTGRLVRVGASAPLAILEAVPAGQLGMARDGRVLQLVLVAEEGRAFRSVMDLDAGAEYPEARAVALAVEALEDLARERDWQDRSASRADAAAPNEDLGPEGGLWEKPAMPLTDVTASDATRGALPPRDRVEPWMYMRGFMGVSPLDHELAAGVGTGLGVCLVGHCLLVGGDMPLTPAHAGTLRYRHATFHLRFHTRPWKLGRWTPGASFGLVTHVGQARPREGTDPAGMLGGTQTAVGARGSLELAYRLTGGLELMTEWGLDRSLERSRYVESSLIGRDWSPWLLVALRVSP